MHICLIIKIRGLLEKFDTRCLSERFDARCLSEMFDTRCLSEKIDTRRLSEKFDARCLSEKIENTKRVIIKRKRTKKTRMTHNILHIKLKLKQSEPQKNLSFYGRIGRSYSSRSTRRVTFKRHECHQK